LANKTRTNINLVGASTVAPAAKPKKRKLAGKKNKSRGRLAASKVGSRGRGRSSRP
tara:strand:- start:337 stop:504 length:168 start_codon:yes stop_codon:yes gene_type:complete